MNFDAKKLDGSRIELTVSLDEHDLKGYINETEKYLANSLRLKGFRTGKVSRDLVRKHLGDGKIRQEALSLAVRSSLADVLKKEKFDIINQPADSDFKIKENSSKELVYQAILTVFPEVKLGKYTGLNVKKRTVFVSEPEINNVLHELQELRVQKHEVDRPAQIGDRVEVDFLLTLKGREIEGGKSQNHPLILGKDAFIPGFEERIIGMEAGEKKKFSLKIPVGYYQKNIAGKEIDINLDLKKIDNLTVPELSDEFAKNLGPFGSLKELKDNIQKNLTLEKDVKEKERTRLEILNQIVATSRLMVPPLLVEGHLDALIHEFDAELHQKGMELGPYLAHIKKTQDDLRKDWRGKAESRVKTSLVARAIARTENISVSDQEIAQELAVIADHYAGKGILDELQNADPEVVRSKIRDALLNEKVFEFLEKNNAVA